MTAHTRYRTATRHQPSSYHHIMPHTTHHIHNLCPSCGAAETRLINGATVHASCFNCGGIFFNHSRVANDQGVMLQCRFALASLDEVRAARTSHTTCERTEYDC